MSAVLSVRLALPVIISLLVAGIVRAEVAIRSFGTTPDGREVKLYTLQQRSGLHVAVMNYGAAIVRLEAPDAKGKFADVVLGFDRLEGYLGKNPYFGAIIGRYTNRIREGRFSLDGKAYQLSINDTAHAKPHQLHGGRSGFDKKYWESSIISQNPPSVRFQLVSPDGEEGYPGNLNAAVIYTVSNNTLKIEFTASTDKTTIYNPTSHIYFNLAGQGLVDGQWLMLNSRTYLEIDSDWVPTGKLQDVAGTKFDFNRPTRLGDRFYESRLPKYIDHTFVLNTIGHGPLSFAAELFDPVSRRCLKIFTNQPGLHCYPGNSLDGSVTGKRGESYPQYSGICLEPQNFPDAPNHPNFPSAVLRSGEEFKSITVYEFSIK